MSPSDPRADASSLRSDTSGSARAMGYSLGREDDHTDAEEQDCIIEYDQDILHLLEDAEF